MLTFWEDGKANNRCSYLELSLANSLAIDSADGTPPEYKRQVGAEAIGLGFGIPNRSSPLIKTVGVP